MLPPFPVLDVDFAMVGKANFSLTVAPESIDRYEGFREAWDASDTPDEEFSGFAAMIRGDDWEVPNTLDLALGALDPRHGVVGRAPVDQVVLVWVAVHSASAVEYESNGATGR